MVEFTTSMLLFMFCLSIQLKKSKQKDKKITVSSTNKKKWFILYLAVLHAKILYAATNITVSIFFATI